MSEKDSFTVEADSELHKAVLTARKAGKRYGGKLYSCTLAFELGAKILLGIEEKEEENLKQELEELKSQKAEIEQKEALRVQQLQIMAASKTAKITEAADQNGNIQKLAQRIIEVWDKVVINNNHLIIDSLINIDKTKLNRPKLEAIFPRRYTPKPSIDDAVKMAMDLLNYEGESIDA